MAQNLVASRMKEKVTVSALTESGRVVAFLRKSFLGGIPKNNDTRSSFPQHTFIDDIETRDAAKSCMFR